MVTHLSTQSLVEFAVIHQAFSRCQWRCVAMADSCHDDDVHLHRYARSTDDRIGEPEVLVTVTGEDDLQRGYDLAYDLIVESWNENRRRWQDA
jgi:hypothetical protein